MRSSKVVFVQNAEKSASLRTIEERVHGWVGIQRFDDANDYGVDLIRNGRAIRKSEKEAFFSWNNIFGDGRSRTTRSIALTVA